MIYEVIKAAIETVEPLTGKVFPTSVVVDEEEPPFAVYTFGEQTAVTDLSGAVHHYVDEVLIDFWAATYDQVWELYRAAEHALRAMADREDGCGECIFGVECGSPNNDAADLDLGLNFRRMTVSVQWCDL